MIIDTAFTQLEAENVALKQRITELEAQAPLPTHAPIDNPSWQQLIAQLPITIYIYDLVEQRNVYANRELFAELGYSAADLQQMGEALLTTIFHPADLARIGEHHARCASAKAGDVQEIEYRVRKSNGEWIWLLSRDMPFKYTAVGTVQQILGVSFDISERKRTENEFRIFKALTDKALDSIVIGDMNGVVTYANQRAKTFSQYGDDVIGMAGADFYPASELPKVAEIMTALQTAGYWQGETMHLRKDKSAYPAQISAYLIPDDLGQPIALASVARDLTSLHEREQRLEQSEFRLQTLLSNLPIIMTGLDAHGIISYSAGSGLSLNGLQPGQMVGVSVFDMYQQTPETLGPIKQALAGENLQFTSEAHDRIYDNWLIPQYDEHGKTTSVLGVSIDTTDRRIADAERQALQDQVIAAQQVALVELSTPLIPIANGVVVMPLIGSIDSGRAQKVLETLLSGVAESRANRVILDITGVPVVDTQVANALLRAAQAVKLLGAQIILTGIRPEVAQTLVGLGIDLSGIQTLGTLQSGIALALGR
jgi:rsbT co-antagonist protein RsbR